MTVTPNPYPGNEVQLARHLQKIEMNVRRYLSRWFEHENGKWSPISGTPTSDWLQKAQARAMYVAGNLVKKMKVDYEKTGMIDPSLSTYEKFCSYLRFASKNLYREEQNLQRAGITGASKEMWESEDIRIVPNIARSDDSTHEYSLIEDAVEVKQVWSSAVGAREQIDDHEWIKTLATVLLPRIIEVLGRRSGHGSLSVNQVESLWLVLAEAKVPLPIPQHILELLDSFDSNAGSWRRQLAEKRAAEKVAAQDDQVSTEPEPEANSAVAPTPPRHVSQSSITNDINRARRLLTTCLYLFVTLAPYSSVVKNADDMDRLLDLIFTPNCVLNANQRKVLQLAGECLRSTGPQYEVAVPEVHAMARNKRGLQMLSEADLLDFLHQAEEQYATQVPGQDRIRPRYSCVKQCPTHLQTYNAL